MADLIPENIVDECKAFNKEDGSDDNLWTSKLVAAVLCGVAVLSLMGILFSIFRSKQKENPKYELVDSYELL